MSHKKINEKKISPFVVKLLTILDVLFILFRIQSAKELFNGFLLKLSPSLNRTVLLRKFYQNIINITTCPLLYAN